MSQIETRRHMFGVFGKRLEVALPFKIKISDRPVCHPQPEVVVSFCRVALYSLLEMGECLLGPFQGEIETAQVILRFGILRFFVDDPCKSG